MKRNECLIIKYENAVEEAERFLAKAGMALTDIRECKSFHFGGIHTAAAKRSSMDLTRALANLRKI